MRFLGWGLPLIVFGTLAAFATAIVVAVLPLPAPPREPQVTPARVVD